MQLFIEHFIAIFNVMQRLRENKDRRRRRRKERAVFLSKYKSSETCKTLQSV
jgi:hypothetical protein